ncbi:hypothetical protein CMV_015218 [Castanea mollissima]|uniref:Clustered mitochondria protein n=1 Tax=Castanea mollissima TaxID=60419 RepID=A0A8J4VT31_9ROSI|nr:hypothetical protein CMV_015218 [Castanea mollissima]
MPPVAPRSGDAIFANVERVNAELFTLTYGAIVRQLLTDLEQDQGGHQSSGKPSKGQGRFKGGASARKNQLSFMNVSSETQISVRVVRGCKVTCKESFCYTESLPEGDMAGVIMQQHKELIINERCLGLDHPDTVHSYGNLALFYHVLNQTELALWHVSRALLLLSLSSGPDHPNVAATFINVAMMLLGKEHIQTAVCYHALAIAFNCMGAFKLSHQHEKKTYDILVKQLGEEDSRTRDSQNWMKTFKMCELQMNAQKQKGQALNAASALKAIDILKAHPDLIQAFQAGATAGGSGSSGTFVNKSLNAAIIGGNPPRGRGVDERATHAAFEVRKKAAARGLLIRPHGVPVQAVPPLTQLLNIINSGMTPDAAEGGETDGVKKEANGHPSNGPVDSKNDELTSGQENQAPVGLGTGLASLDAKKQKAKAKAAA